MTSQITKGIELMQDIPGSGPSAERGSTVTYNARFFLRRGDEVTHDGEVIANMLPGQVPTRLIEGTHLIDHETVLGSRHAIPAVEKALRGMQAGGYREVLASPHLCYGARGIPDRIPPNAMLRIKLWVQAVE